MGMIYGLLTEVVISGLLKAKAPRQLPCHSSVAAGTLHGDPEEVRPRVLSWSATYSVRYSSGTMPPLGSACGSG